MNMQVTPRKANTDLPTRHDVASGGGCVFLIGGAALIAALVDLFLHPQQQRQFDHGQQGAVAPVKIAVAEEHNMPVIERTIRTVVLNSTVSVTARVQGRTKAAGRRKKNNEQEDGAGGDPQVWIRLPRARALEKARAQMPMPGSRRRNKRTGDAQQKSAADQRQCSGRLYDRQGNAEAARLNLQFTEIRSPIDGKTGPILIQPGNVILVAGITATVAPLVTITQIQPIKISFACTQADLPHRARARSASCRRRILLHDVGGEDLAAPVDFISNTVNATSGTIELRATFLNADSALVPGQLVNVVVELANIPHAIVVPREAVNTGPAGQYIYTVNDKVAVQEPVKVLFDDSTDVAIQGNFKAGDKVIIDGQLRVVPGAKVSFAPAKPAVKNKPVPGPDNEDAATARGWSSATPMRAGS